MKRITIILMSIAALAIASSCNKILNPESTHDGYIRKTIHLTANEILTDKAAFGDITSEGYPMLWQSGDEVVLSINGDPDLTQVLTVTPTDGGSTADFGDITVTLPAEGSVEIFVSTNTTTESAGRNGTIKHSPTAADSQKPEATSCDPSSILLYAKKSYSSAADVPVDNIKLDFHHSTAYGKMTISGITLNGGETVKFVEIQTPKGQNIGGTVTIADDGSISGGSVPSIIMRNIPDFSNPIWFAIAPTVLNSASALMVHVVTSEDRHFEKTLNCSSNPLEFNAGRVSKFTVSFSGISAAPRQVKTVRDLVLLKNAFNNSDYNYWLNSGNEILLANDLEYGGSAVTGNVTDVPAGVTFNGQGFAIRNATISATIFRHVNGTVKNLKVEGGTNSTYLFNTIPGNLKGLNVMAVDVQSSLISSVSGSVENISLDDIDIDSYIIGTISATGTAEGITINNGSNSKYLFDAVYGLLKDVHITGLDSNYILIHNIYEGGIVDGLTVDKTTTYECPWFGNNMSFVALTSNGLITDSIVEASVNAGDPARSAFNFGVFTGKLTGGRYVRCVNKGDVNLTNTSAVSNACGLGGIVGTITSSQSNSVRILEECGNEGNITLTLNYPGDTKFHRICCVGGIAGGSYKAGLESVTGQWKDESYPSSGVIYKCTNTGTITLNYNSIWKNTSDDDSGSQGASIGGIIGATINDIDHCTNIGSIIANYSLNTTYATQTNAKIGAGAPKVGGIVGAAHGIVTYCVNDTDASIEINGYTRNCASGLFHGTGPIQYPCYGGVAGCVGCDTAANSDAAGSEISYCENKSANITNNTTYGTTYIGSVCGWTSAYNIGNTNTSGTSTSVIGTSIASTPSTATTGAPLPK